MSTKFTSPLLGYNNNVRHKGKVFHIQTEDSGAKYGHIITHLFMDGGRILKSVKTSYAEYIGNERMSEIVREMMKQQHKAMFIALRDGRFDAVVDGSAEASQAVRALSAEAGAPGSKSAAPAPASAPADGAAAAQQPAGSPALTPKPAKQPTAAPPASFEEDLTDSTIRQPREELVFDIISLERAAPVANGAAPALRGTSDLPPPPANLFRERTATGNYRITPVPPMPAAAPDGAPHADKPGSASAHPSSPPTPAATAPARRSSQVGPGAERRYAPTRPASIFGQARPQQGKTIFGEDLISDKSLDEVILSYLSEDLDEKK